MTTTRRELLRRGWELGGALLAAAAGFTVYESLRPLASAASGGPLILGSPSQYQPQTATYVSQGRLFVVNTGDTLYALSQKCPHLGCRVPYCDSSGRFECPCHGSTYDLGGEWIVGPAPRGMDRYDLKLVGAQLVADTSKVITGPPHGAKRYLTPPKGPSCIPKA
jgi:cytochrome b6-f complex iron-sulfur subunit